MFVIRATPGLPKIHHSCCLHLISLEDHSSFEPYVGTYIVLTWITTNARCCLFVGWLYPQPQYVVLKSTEHDLYPVIFRWYPHFVLVISFPSDWCNSWFRKVYLQSYIVGWLLFEVNKMQLYPCSYYTLLYLISPCYPCCISLIPIHTVKILRGRSRGRRGRSQEKLFADARAQLKEELNVFVVNTLGSSGQAILWGRGVSWWIQWISLKDFKGIYVATQNGIHGDF